jgi:hypothetical protein
MAWIETNVGSSAPPDHFIARTDTQARRPISTASVPSQVTACNAMHLL